MYVASAGALESESESPKGWSGIAARARGGGVALPWERGAPESESESPKGWSGFAARARGGGVALPWECEAPESEGGSSKGWSSIAAGVRGGGGTAATVRDAGERGRARAEARMVEQHRPGS